MLDNLRKDFRAVFEMDPAATGRFEVLFTYAGFHAMLMHRIAHWLYRMGMPFFARVVSQVGRFLTGVEIHPAAKIGGGVFIDHGMGVVIGETSEIGENVVIFQGATLGGTGKERGKRHPTIGSNVVIGAGSKVLGAITIGDHVKIGANAVVLRSVPPHSTVVGVPGRVVKVHGRRTAEEEMLEHGQMPDPVNEMLSNMQKQISRLEQKVLGKSEQRQPEQRQDDGGHGGGSETRQKKRRPRRDSQDGAHKPTAEAELPTESVKERHARMARMEKEERMKAAAIRRTREKAATAPTEEGGEGPASAPAKKRVRRRRRGPKDQPGQGGQGGQGEQGVQGGQSTPERPQTAEEAFATTSSPVDTGSHEGE